MIDMTTKRSLAFFALLGMLSFASFAEAQMFPYSPKSANEEFDSDRFITQTHGQRRSGDVTGALVFELTKKAHGSGRIFGQATPLPFTHVEIRKLNGDLLSPEREWFGDDTVTDSTGQFAWADSFPGWNPNNKDKVIVRMYGDSRRPNGTTTRITQGPTFSPFERRCTDGSDNFFDGCNSAERWEQHTEAYLEKVLACMLYTAENDVRDVGDNSCKFEEPPLQIDYWGLTQQLFNIKDFLSGNVERWHEAESLGSELAAQYEEKIAATREYLEFVVDGFEHELDGV